MSSYYEKSVTVTVSLDTSASDALTYSNVLALCAHNLDSSTYQTYTDSDDVLSAGFATNSPAYTLINNMYSAGSFPPEYVNLGRVNIETYTIQVTDAFDEDTELGVYVNMNGTEKEVTYTVLSTDTTAALIATGLASALTTAYDNSSDSQYPVFAASDDTITVTIESTTYPCSFGWATSTSNIPHVIVGSTTSDSLATVITSCVSGDSDVTFVVSEYHTEDYVKVIAAACEGELLQYFTSTQDSTVADTDSTSNIAIDLVALEYDQTSIQYSATADTYFPEGALLGWLAGLNPYDIYNPSFWTFSGVPTDTLSSTQRQTLAGRNVNFYVSTRGEGRYYHGWAVSGEFVDTVRFGSIWSKETLYEILDDLLYKKSRLGRAVPYSDEGAAMISSIIQSDYCDVGIAGGRIADGTSTDSTTGDTVDLSPTITVGTRADQTDSNISNRIWDGVEVDVVMLSGINHINLSLYVELNA